VEKTQGINRKGWVLTGGVTFYESPLTLDNVQIIGSKAEDAVNIIRSNYAFRNSEFGYSVSDAFDSDFSQGHISYCSFHDIGGDAIDVSGSELTLSFTNLSAVEDKAVSAGEHSSVVIDNVSISEIGIGIASKDLSSVLVNGTTIAHAKHTALAAFVKKPEYGPATIDADELTIIDTSVHAMVQTNSMVKVNGVTLDTNDLNVDALYAQGVLGN
jgi:hypothetical protein